MICVLEMVGFFSRFVDTQCLLGKIRWHSTEAADYSLKSCYFSLFPRKWKRSYLLTSFENSITQFVDTIYTKKWRVSQKNLFLRRFFGFRGHLHHSKEYRFDEQHIFTVDSWLAWPPARTWPLQFLVPAVTLNSEKVWRYLRPMIHCILPITTKLLTSFFCKIN